MTRRMFFILGLVSSLAIGSYAQARRTVTNADLDRYRQRRVAAEQELEQNYERMGFASPEDLRQRQIESTEQLIALSQQLKEARLERERMEIERERLGLERERMMLLINPPTIPYGYNDAVQPGELFYPTFLGFGGGRGRFRHGFRGVPQQQGYFAAGQFWPEGPRVAPRPFIAQPRSVPAPPPVFRRH